MNVDKAVRKLQFHLKQSSSFGQTEEAKGKTEERKEKTDEIKGKTKERKGKKFLQVTKQLSAA
jgi:hypothetical protein